MLEKIYINKPANTDLNMYRCGMEDCKPGHSWGPAVRDHYIIHYILKGKGFYQVGGKTFNLEKDDGFLICPNTVIYYEADLDDPWSYAWVGFHGIKAEIYLNRANLSAENPIFRYDKDDFLTECFKQMISTKNLSKAGEIRLLGLLYVFLSQLIEEFETKHVFDKDNKKESYIKKALEFIAMNYSRKITITEIANYVGLDRSYLYSIFKELLNVSPQEFLVSYRIDMACQLMRNINLSIGDIARSVGYDDQLQFSKVFKKVKGTPPRQFRKEQR
ncbi:MAG TPA: AraC family transcriptional regulator [Clostridiaceae bacterium]|nr:AraC family transcriptional regulator [Clostridiaceae bacterium]